MPSLASPSAALPPPLTLSPSAEPTLATPFRHQLSVLEEEGQLYLRLGQVLYPEISWNDILRQHPDLHHRRLPHALRRRGLCNATIGREYFLTTAAGSGGPSSCGTGYRQVPDQPNRKRHLPGLPQTQLAGGSFGNPTDGVRNLPDVSLFAANGVWGPLLRLLLLSSHGGAACTGAPYLVRCRRNLLRRPHRRRHPGAGRPDDRNGQGQSQYAYYLARQKEYRVTGNNSCNSLAVNGIDGSCIFNDVTGRQHVPFAGHLLYNCYRPSGTVGVLSVSSSEDEPAYGTRTGWDFASGLGTLNVDNLFRNWRRAYE